MDFAGRLKNPDLRANFSHLGPFPMARTIELLGLLHSKSAGYVTGGTLALVRPIEKRYLELAVNQFNSRVAKILVENNKAAGIRLADGTEHRTDYIISAGDGRTAIFEMLGGNTSMKRLKTCTTAASFRADCARRAGVNRAFDDAPSSTLNYPLVKPIVIAGKTQK